MSQKIIKQSVEILRDVGGYLACWSRAVYPSDEGHKFTRLDKVFLNLIFEDNDGTPAFRRISACMRDVPYKGPVQAYALEQTYRITSGYRKGCVVAWDDLEGDEHYQPAGVSRQLAYAPVPYAFHEYHQSDRAAFNLLRKLPQLEHRTTLLSHVPTLYLTYRPDQAHTLFLRKTGEAMRWMRDNLPMDAQGRGDDLILMQHHQMVAEDAGHGRYSLPYGFVHGRGVIAAAEHGDFKFDTWVRVPDIRLELNCLEVCHELEDVLRNEEYTN